MIQEVIKTLFVWQTCQQMQIQDVFIFIREEKYDIGSIRNIKIQSSYEMIFSSLKET